MKFDTLTTPWGKEIQAYAREGTCDWNTLQSCIVEDEYQIGKLGDHGVAIDLGAYIGGATLALISKGWYVYAVEPLPENVELLEKNLKINGFEKSCTIIEKAIGSSEIFYGDTSTEFGKVHEFIGSNEGGRSIEAATTTLSEIMENRRCNFLKIDIEGAEWMDFPEDILSRIDRIAVEIEGNPTNTEDYLKILKGQFRDVSKEYFPKWSEPSNLVHGYYINKKI